MTTTEAPFYDHAMTCTGALAMLPLAESPWLPVYQEAAVWISPAHEVVDLGCGTGRFLRLLLDRDHYGRLSGLDFSQAAVDVARTYLPDTTIDIADLRAWEPDGDRAGNTTYVCLEVLEHLEDDQDLVRRIPPGHDLVFSVPNYESQAHLRVFHDAGDIVRRYDSWLDFRRWSLIALDDRHAIHLMHGRRRLGAW